MKFTVYISFSLLLLCACKKSEERTCFKGWGDENATTTEYFDAPIDSIKIEDNVIVHLYQDTLNYAEVVGGSNVIHQINFNITDRNLMLENLNKCNFLRSYKKKIHVHLHLKKLVYIFFSGGEDLIMENQFQGGEMRIFFRDGGGTIHANVDMGYFAIEVTGGAGDFIVKGKAQQAYIKVQSNGYGDASALETPELIMYNKSSGDLYGHVNDNGRLRAEIHYKGNNYYTGSFDSITKIDQGEGANIHQ